MLTIQLTTKTQASKHQNWANPVRFSDITRLGKGSIIKVPLNDKMELAEIVDFTNPVMQDRQNTISAVPLAFQAFLGGGTVDTADDADDSGVTITEKELKAMTRTKIEEWVKKNKVDVNPDDAKNKDTLIKMVKKAVKKPAKPKTVKKQAEKPEGFDLTNNGVVKIHYRQALVPVE